MTPDKEDFDAWLDNPVTVHVFKKFAEMAEKAKAEWVHQSWHQGLADPLMLADLRARAEVVNDLVTVSYEDIKDEDDAKE